MMVDGKSVSTVMLRSVSRIDADGKGCDRAHGWYNLQDQTVDESVRVRPARPTLTQDVRHRRRDDEVDA